MVSHFVTLDESGPGFELYPLDPPATFAYLKELNGAVNPAILGRISEGRLVVGDAITTASYWAGGATGGGTYIVTAPGTGLDDGGSYINAGSVQLQAVFGGTVDVAQFGAKGDGVTDDTAAIQAAVNAAVVRGHVISFPPGTFAMATPTESPNTDLVGSRTGAIVLDDLEGVAIQGASRDLTTITWIDTSVEHRLIGAWNAAGVSISGVTLDGRCSATTPWSTGIQGATIDGLIISDCRFKDFGSAAVRPTFQSARIDIRGNEFLGIHGGFGVITKGVGADDVDVSNNVFDTMSCAISIESENLTGPATEISERIVVANNRIRNMVSVSGSIPTGINVSESAQNISISGNTIETFDGTGATIAYGVVAHTSRNQSDAFVDGVSITGNVIRDVTCSAGRGVGIELNCGEEAVTNVAVSGNVIMDAEIGVAIQPGPTGTSAQIDAVTIIGNVISGGARGIFLNTTTSAVAVRALAVANNVIRNVTGDAINLWVQTGTITGNTIDGCDRGIYVNNLSSDIAIIANSIANFTTDDVVFFGSGHLMAVQIGASWIWSNGSGVMYAKSTKPTSVTDGIVIGTQT